MKKITIFGSVGYNIGDEAIAVAAANKLLEIDKDLIITISTLKKGVIEGKYTGLNEFYLQRNNLNGWKHLFEQIKDSDLIVLGGGTMVQDKLGISVTRGMIPYMLQLTLISKILRKPVITLPIGVDKLNTKLGKVFSKKFLNSIDKLYVRDEQSLSLAQNYASKLNNGTVCSDPAFFLEVKEGKIINSRKYVTISLVNENLDKSSFIPAIKDCINWIIKNTELDIYLVPMDRRNEEELTLFAEIIGKNDSSSSERIKIIDAEQNVFQITNILRNSELLIGMRLHALILSIGYTEIIGISRTTKTENFFKEFGLDYFDINKKSINKEELTSLVKENLLSLEKSNRDNIINKLDEKKEKYETGMQEIYSYL
ncbi:polysaccharide pyruvyl transferase family protein [Niallia taxi]|uniref:polysaccharide pyruvyl transferase family protein n=1 Tax=Niallia taxi TaxID=2499688 RepID=UPI003F6212E9